MTLLVGVLLFYLRGQHKKEWHQLDVSRLDVDAGVTGTCAGTQEDFDRIMGREPKPSPLDDEDEWEEDESEEEPTEEAKEEDFEEPEPEDDKDEE